MREQHFARQPDKQKIKISNLLTLELILRSLPGPGKTQYS